MIKDIESRTRKPIDPLDIKVVHRPEPEIKKVAAVQNVPQGRGPASPPARTNGAGLPNNRTFVEINFGNADGLSKAEVVKLVKTGHRPVTQEMWEGSPWARDTPTWKLSGRTRAGSPRTSAATPSGVRPWKRGWSKISHLPSEANLLGSPSIASKRRYPRSEHS